MNAPPARSVADFRRKPAAPSGHAVAACLAGGAVAATFATGLTVPVVSQAAFLACGVAAVGMPHGALDPMIARPALRPTFGRLWVAALLAGYVGLIGVTLLGWFFAPVATVIVFFALSAFHFGLDDQLMAPANSRAARLAAAWFAGGMAVGFPILADPEFVRESVEWIVPGPADALPAGWSEAASGVVLWGVLPGWLGLIAWHERRRTRLHRLEAARLTCLGAMLLLAPPLVGFGVYFCLWHSWRALGRLKEELGLSPGLAGWTAFARMAAPAVLVTAAAGGACAWQSGLRPEEAVTQNLFLTLSSVAVPHMLLHWWLGWAGRGAGR